MPIFKDREEKTAARERMIAPLQPATSLLSLPGRELLCVREMIDKGVITPATKLYFVESNLEATNMIRSESKALNLRPHVIWSDIRDMSVEEPFDLLNLDLEEGFTPRLGLWFEKSAAPCIMDGATLLVTMTAFSRNAEPSTFARWVDDEILRDRRLGAGYEIIRDEANHFSASMFRSVLLVACALRDTHSVTLESCYYYQDDMPMYWFRLKADRVARPVNLPKFSELRDKFASQYARPSWTVDNDAVVDRSAALQEARRKREEILGTKDGITVRRGQRVGGFSDEETIERQIATLREELERVRRRKDYHHRGVKAAATKKANAAARAAEPAS